MMENYDSEYRSLFESLAKVRQNLETILQLSNVDDDAFSWIMFAYVSSEDDEHSYRKVRRLIVSELDEKLHYEVADNPSLALRVADLTIAEALGGDLKQSHRASILGVSKPTYYRNAHRYNSLMEVARNVVVDWEQEARNKMLENSRSSAIEE